MFDDIKYSTLILVILVLVHVYVILYRKLIGTVSLLLTSIWLILFIVGMGASAVFMLAAISGLFSSYSGLIAVIAMISCIMCASMCAAAITLILKHMKILLSFEELLTKWERVIRRRIMSILRKHYLMLIAMSLLNVCGAFKHADSLDELIWVLYSIYCERDEHKEGWYRKTVFSSDDIILSVWINF